MQGTNHKGTPLLCTLYIVAGLWLAIALIPWSNESLIDLYLYPYLDRQTDRSQSFNFLLCKFLNPIFKGEQHHIAFYS